MADCFTLDHGVSEGNQNPSMKDEAIVFLRAYGCVLDYNPVRHKSRVVAEFGDVKITISFVEVRT